tara:strand:+ start:107 stop:319 length:213 start_codon:yes stop_codon:yes gene_type:complete
MRTFPLLGASLCYSFQSLVAGALSQVTSFSRSVIQAALGFLERLISGYTLVSQFYSYLDQNQSASWLPRV